MMLTVNTRIYRWRLFAALCLLVIPGSSQIEQMEEDFDREFSTETEGDWPLDLIANLNQNVEVWKDMLNLADDRICSSEEIYEAIVGKNVTNLVGYQWWRERCGDGKSMSAKGKNIKNRQKSKRKKSKSLSEMTQQEREKLNSLINKVKCKPKKMVVVLSKDNDPHLRFSRPCVLLKRCSGCCDSSILECHPNQVKHKKLNVQASNGTGREFQHTVTVDVHKSCKCVCKVREEHCNKAIQRYDEGLCRCICLSRYRDCPRKKYWSNTQCGCVCRPKKCVGDFQFDTQHCRCQPKAFV